MNDQVQNIVEQVQAEPAIFTFDKDGNPVEVKIDVDVKVIGPNEVQDVEYSEDPKGN